MLFSTKWSKPPGIKFPAFPWSQQPGPAEESPGPAVSLLSPTDRHRHVSSLKQLTLPQLQLLPPAGLSLQGPQHLPFIIVKYKILNNIK